MYMLGKFAGTLYKNADNHVRFTIKNDVCSSNVVDGVHKNIIVV